MISCRGNYKNNFIPKFLLSISSSVEEFKLEYSGIQSLHVPEPKFPHVCSALRAWTMDGAAIVRSKVTPKIKEDLISVSMIILSPTSPLLLPDVHLYEKPPGFFAVRDDFAIDQQRQCLGGLDMPEYFLLQRLRDEFIMTLLSLPEFARSNKLPREKPRFIVSRGVVFSPRNIS